MTKKKTKCPWCKATDVSIKTNDVQSGEVVERRCGSCGNVLAAYKKDEGNFLPGIRVFQND